MGWKKVEILYQSYLPKLCKNINVLFSKHIVEQSYPDIWFVTLKSVFKNSNLGI